LIAGKFTGAVEREQGCDLRARLTQSVAPSRGKQPQQFAADTNLGIFLFHDRQPKGAFEPASKVGARMTAATKAILGHAQTRDASSSSP
jgi:hypothetical protein